MISFEVEKPEVYAVVTIGRNRNLSKKIMSKPHIVVADPLDVLARLRALGLTTSDLTGALRDAASAMALCTENHPPIYGGLTFWAESVRSLRERKLQDGWSRNDAWNYSTVVNTAVGIQVAVARGDEWTGDLNSPDGKPSTKHRKGVATLRAVETNHQQLDLFDRIPDTTNDEGDSPLITWVLLHYRAGQTIRCELSTPTAITSAGFVEAWQERLILDNIDLEGTSIRLPDDQPVERDVLVRRRR